MPPSTRVRQAHALLAKALREFVPPTDLGAVTAGDLGANQQVHHYNTASDQRQYVHMYAAKHLGAWLALRRVLQWEDRVAAPLMSIGAGPLLCLMGWCLEAPWKGPISECEPVDWSAVRTHPDWASAAGSLCGSPSSMPGVFIPGPKVPFQLQQGATVSPLRYLPGKNVPDGAVVLVPFVLNHLLEGGTLPSARAREMASWLSEAEANGCRIVMADLHTASVDLWPPLLAACGRTGLVQETFHFPAAAREQQPLYPTGEIADYRTGCRYPKMCEARVLVIDEKGWRFLGGWA